MKGYTIYLSLILLAVLGALSSCKKDKGNYDYIDVPVPAIDTTGIGHAYSLERYENLKIAPGITYTGGDMSRLKYQWLIYPIITGSVSTIVPAKEISSEKELDITLSEAIGNYNVELLITDTVNKLKVNSLFTVSIAPPLEYGVLVLHTKGTGNSDIDFFVTQNAVPIATIKEKRLRNIYSASTGAPIPGEPRFVVQSRFSNTVVNRITVGSSTQLSRMNGSDFSLMYENNELFRRPVQLISPDAFQYTTAYYEVLINNGRVHFHNSTFVNDAFFPIEVSGDYEAAPYIANATASSLLAAVYDKKNGRFVHPNASGVMLNFLPPADDSQPFDLTNIGKDLLYMDRGYSNFTHAFFKDKTGTGRYMDVINFNSSDNGKLGIARYDMSNLPDISAAKFYQVNELGYVAYYATEKNIYFYDYRGGTASIAFSSFPASETITCLQIYKPRPNFNLTAVEGRILYVGTWDGTQGKVYEFSINPTSGAIDPAPLNVFDGFGKIVDISAKARGAGTL